MSGNSCSPTWISFPPRSSSQIAQNEICPRLPTTQKIPGLKTTRRELRPDDSLTIGTRSGILSIMNRRQRASLFALLAVASAWLLAWGGYALAQHFKVTAEKLRVFVEGTDLNGLSDEARARALRKLADMVNALPAEERQQARLNHLWGQWFNEMTDDERGAFLDATLPSGFKQMLSSFENLAPDKRQKTIDTAIKQLKDARDATPEEFQKKSARQNTNAPVLSEDLQRKVVFTGLQSVYGNSSAETKAELAPLLEEVQKNMESGRLFRGGN
jgi:hypothetical protein